MPNPSFRAAAKLSSFGRNKSKDEEALKKKSKATKDKIRQLKKAGLNDDDIKKILDKGAK